MKTDKDKGLMELAQRSPFWVCFIVFLLLAGDYGFRLTNLLQQRSQLDQARLMQAQNAGVLDQARKLEARLEALSLELLQVAKTNSAARQIVQDFNIQWNPNPAAASRAPELQPVAGGAKK